MNEMKSQTETEAKAEAIVISRNNPGKYVTVFSCFGLFASIKSRLNVFEPSDSYFGWYALNGKIKNFTEKQKIADELATPILS